MARGMLQQQRYAEMIRGWSFSGLFGLHLTTLFSEEATEITIRGADTNRAQLYLSALLLC